MYTNDFQVKPSKIHGKGLFSLKKLSPGQIIFISFISNKSINELKIFEREFYQTNINIYSNHSIFPNTKMIYNKDTKAFAKMVIKTINPGDEIVSNYNESMKYIRKNGFQLLEDWLSFQRPDQGMYLCMKHYCLR